MPYSKKRIIAIVLIITSIVFSGVVVADNSGCMNIRDIVDITDGEDTTVTLTEDEFRESPAMEGDKFVITGDNSFWIKMACYALTK